MTTISNKMNTNITFPSWLDSVLFEELGANYCRSNTDMTVIGWDKRKILNYLGTYFSRSYAESYCIFSHYLPSNTALCEQPTINLFDFGCGTGGEIIGFLTALNEQQNLQVQEVKITALDGNQNALRLYERVLERLIPNLKFQVSNRVSLITIDDIYDLSIIDDIYKEETYDVFLSFKAICEFVTKQQFEENNAYTTVLKTFLPKLTQDGIALLVDVTSYNSVAEEWLPMMLDAGIADANGKVIEKNEGYNQVFTVSHSRKQHDISKIAYRIIKNQ